MPLAEVGARAGVSENAARMRVERALERLRVLLSKRGVVATSLALGATLSERAVSAAPAETAARIVAGSATLATAGSGALVVVKAAALPVGGVLALASVLVLFLAGRDGSWSLRRASDDPGGRATAAGRGHALAATTSYLAPHVLPRGGLLQGRVVDPQGLAVPGATVSGRRRPGGSAGAVPLPGAASAPDGTFLLPGVPAGIYTVSVEAKGFAPAEFPGVEVLDGVQIGWIELALRERGSSLSGRVLDAGGGIIAGAIIELASGWRSGQSSPPRRFTLTTDAQGSYSARLPNLPYSADVSAPGYATALAYVDLQGDQQRDFRLEPAAVVSGIVVEAAGRRPVGGAQVFIDSFADRERPRIEVVTADEQGNFRIPGLPYGSYRVIARKGDLVGATPQRFTVTAGSVVERMTIEVAPGLVLAGSVRLQRETVDNARVSLGHDRTGGNSGPLMTVSGPRGAFILRGLLPGEYNLSVSYRNWGGGPWFDEEISLRTSLTKEVELEEASVRGVVLTSAGRPAMGAKVEAASEPRNPWRGPMATSDAEGRFTLREVRPSLGWIDAHHAGESARIARRLPGPGEVEEVVIRLAPDGQVSGQVRWEDGAPAAGVRLDVMARGPLPAGPSPYTDQAGRFTIAAIAPVDVAIAAIANGNHAGPRLPGEYVSLKIAPGEHRAGVELVLSRRAGRIRGTVHLPGGSAAPGASVMAGLDAPRGGFRRPGGAYRSISGADGSFTLEGLPNGRYILWAADPQHVGTQLRGIPVGSADVRLQLEPPASLAGVVVDEAGRPLGSYRITVTPSADVRNGETAPPPPAFSDTTRVPVAHSGGAFEMGPMGAGTYDLTVSTADQLAGSLEGVTVAAGVRRDGLRVVVARARR